jgi:hypothetical protein
MNPGRARNELVPNGLARIVPWKRNLDRTNDVEEVSNCFDASHWADIAE